MRLASFERSVLLGLVLTTGCPSTGASEVERCANRPVCIQDPQPQDICIDSCRDSESCPVGATCIKEVDAEFGRCVVPSTPASIRDRLASGFDVGEMQSALVAEDATETAPGEGPRLLDWYAPPGTVRTTCALFSCPPVIADLGTGNTIINFDRCVLAQQSSTQASGTFDPRSIELSYNPEEPFNPGVRDNCAVRPKASSPDPIQGLWVGCWAYDNWSLTSATKLFELDVEEVLDHRESLTPCEDEDGLGRSCLLVLDSFEPPGDGDGDGAEDGDGDADMELFVEQRFGTCVDADAPRCAFRCMDDEDCEGHCLALEYPASDFSGTCLNLDLSEREEPSSRLGVCIPCSEIEG